MSKVIRVRYERGVLKPLEPIELREGEEVQIIVKVRKGFIAKRFYGIARKHRPELSKDEFLEVVEEVENEDIRGI